jgi:purine-binding chemotaxis protein CheW
MPENAILEPNQRPAIAGKFLTFILGKESYGIPVLKVREIINLVSITVIPQMPDYIKGVINLRGKIIPVIDLRLKFGQTEGVLSERSCIIVVQVNIGKVSPLHMGLIVDGVEEVANISPADIEETPDFGTVVDTAYILGMAKVKGEVKALLDIDRVVATEELQRAL